MVYKWLPAPFPLLPHQKHGVSHPGALSFPEDLRDGPVQSLQRHQPLGRVVEAGLVALQVALLRGEMEGHCQATVGYPPSGTGIPLCRGSRRWDPSPFYKAAVWHSRPQGQQLSSQGTAVEAILRGQNLLEEKGSPGMPTLSLSALE